MNFKKSKINNEIKIKNEENLIEIFLMSREWIYIDFIIFIKKLKYF